MNISLANLGETSLQDIFNHVAEHMLTQNKQAQDEDGNCKYRAEDGLTCAVGCLIDADEYSETMEGESVDSVLKQAGVTLDAEKVELLMCLQNIHDDSGMFSGNRDAVEIWPKMLRDLAETNKLQLPQILSSRLPQPSLVA